MGPQRTVWLPQALREQGLLSTTSRGITDMQSSSLTTLQDAQPSAGSFINWETMKIKSLYITVAC